MTLLPSDLIQHIFGSILVFEFGGPVELDWPRR